jgi:hypothetical protein
MAFDTFAGLTWWRFAKRARNGKWRFIHVLTLALRRSRVYAASRKLKGKGKETCPVRRVFLLVSDMKTDVAGNTLCDGFECQSLAIGECPDLIEVAHWKRSTDYPALQRQYQVIEVQHYCAEHEQYAKHTGRARRVDDQLIFLRT